MAGAPRNWQPLTSQTDLDELMHLFGDFHDACLREVHIATGHWVDEDLSMNVAWPTTAYVLIQRQFRNPCAIELRFEESIAVHLVPPLPDCETIIFHAAFFLREGVFYWAERGDWLPDVTDQVECTSESRAGSRQPSAPK